MGDIYGRAQKVTIWLGEEADNSAAAFKLIDQILALAEVQPNLELNESNLEEKGLPKWAAKLGGFGSWFHRVWVIQEVVRASKAEVACGSITMNFERLVAAFQLVHFAAHSRSFGGEDTAIARPTAPIIAIQFLPNSRLRMMGKLCDAVKAIGSTNLNMKKSVSPRDLHAAINAWLVEANRLISLCPSPYPTGEPLGEAFKRTLFRDQYPDLIDQAFGTLTYFLRELWYRKLLRKESANAGTYEPILPTLEGSVFFVTVNGYMGTAPHGCREGDEIGLLLGGHAPVVLSRQDDEFTLLGDCYVHGMMRGEAFRAEHIPVRPITLSVKVFANRPVKGYFLSVDGGDGDGEGEHGEPEWDDNMVDLMPDEEMHIGVKGLKGIVVRTRFLADWEI